MEHIVVLKVGTSTLMTGSGREKRLDTLSFDRIATQIRQLHLDNIKIVIVSSGAVAAGMIATKQYDVGALTAVDFRRLACVGWRMIQNSWATSFGDTPIGPMLLTKRELAYAYRRQEALTVIASLFQHDSIAIVNENDILTHEDVVYGDNDTLAAALASRINRSKLFTGKVSLVILSDIDGVYADAQDSRTIIREIHDTEKHAHVIGLGGSGTGGMRTKFAAANIATDARIETFITNGRANDTIKNTLKGVAGTRFVVSRVDQQS
jgi:glutamate 5-kinase